VNPNNPDNNPDGIVTDVQKVTDEEFAYIDELISGSKDLDEVKTEIAYNKEQARIAEEERIKAEEEARIKAEEQARAEAEAKAKAEAEARAQAEADAKAAAQAAAEAARRELIAAVTAITENQPASVAQAAATGVPTPDPTPVNLDNAIRDFTPSQTRGSDTSYSASVKQVTVDGVTFLVDDEEENKDRW
jgi:ATPase subunit of ABC transporter with duplicated ATPase domains